MTFIAAKESLGNIVAETAARIISAAADIALVVDGNEVILDATLSHPSLKSDFADVASWLGHKWTDIVTEESRPKVKLLLQDAASNLPAKWRQLAHTTKAGEEIPFQYCAIKIKKDRYLAIGRDLRAVADLQHRLIEAQTSMERDYGRLRHAETRYRVLFHATSDPVLVIDAVTENVVEANPAALGLFGVAVERGAGKSFLQGLHGLDAESTRALKSLADAVRNGSAGDNIRVRIADGQKELVVAILPFRQGADLFFLLQFIDVTSGAGLPPISDGSSKMIDFVRRSTDGYVVVDQSGRIQSANAAFIEMAQLVREEQARGELIERWLGRSGVDVRVMISNLRHQEVVTLFATVIRGEYGATADVEVSAFGLGGGDQHSFGLAIRNVGRRLGDLAHSSLKPPKTVEQLKDLIGRVSLKEMVRDSTDMIEKLCIEAALELTGDNRASAAEMLGLSRQSLYVKLRRYGIADDLAVTEKGSS